ncbi:MAG: aminotransferase class V-fold PLP-dependent enzyme [Acidobacteria bacterium]|nr:aminotransferase class V-fold PLP-dependent enzyme [Acidobacteriota bacterium]
MLRDQFPALARFTYLNTATYGLLSRRGRAAMVGHLDRRDDFACGDFLAWFDDIDRLRAKLARLVGAQADDIAFAPNAATPLSLLLNGLDWAPGDEIVTLENEFPNQLYFPALLANRGVKFVAAPWERLQDQITARTRLIVISQVSYSTGFRPPHLETLDRRNALLYVDATQCLGALRFDGAAVRPDLLAVNGYKWMLAPNGAAFYAVSPALRAQLAPQVIGWRSHFDWRNVNNLHTDAPVFAEAAEKYEGGMLDFPSLYALEAAVDTLFELGPEPVARYALALNETLRAALRRVPGVTLYSDEFPATGPTPITSARFAGREAGGLAARLKAEHNILTSARCGRLRVSPHFYNDENDIDRLLAAL